MNLTPIWPAVAFVAVLALIYIAALYIVVRGLSNWFARGRKHSAAGDSPDQGSAAESPSQASAAGRWQRWGQRGIVALAAAGIACMLYGYFVEPYWLDISHVQITGAHLRPGSSPIRLVHISDLHCDARERLEGRLPETIASLHPDVIVFTGDAANSAEGVPNFRRLMTSLAAVAPTFAIKGNWDYKPYDADLYAGTGVTELRGDFRTLTVRGTEICLAGTGWAMAARVPPLLRRLPQGLLTIFLQHPPDEFATLVAAGNVDLVCAGHTHGGQVALPFYGALLTLSRTGKQFERGLYRAGDTWMYVNRGIGMEGAWAPRVRFLARPEVTLIEIEPNP